MCESKIMMNALFVRSEDTLGSLLRALVHWEDVPCQDLFPTCDLSPPGRDDVEFVEFS